MMDESVRERIAKLELAAENQEKTNEEILKKLDQITTEMTRYKGFLGGIAFFASSLWVAITLFKEYILQHLVK